jgi:hypothetical protein
VSESKAFSPFSYYLTQFKRCIHIVYKDQENPLIVTVHLTKRVIQTKMLITEMQNTEETSMEEMIA